MTDFPTPWPPRYAQRAAAQRDGKLQPHPTASLWGPKHRLQCAVDLSPNSMTWSAVMMTQTEHSRRSPKRTTQWRPILASFAEAGGLCMLDSQGIMAHLTVRKNLTSRNSLCQAPQE